MSVCSFVCAPWDWNLNNIFIIYWFIVWICLSEMLFELCATATEGSLSSLLHGVASWLTTTRRLIADNVSTVLYWVINVGWQSNYILYYKRLTDHTVRKIFFLCYIQGSLVQYTMVYNMLHHQDDPGDATYYIYQGILIHFLLMQDGKYIFGRYKWVPLEHFSFAQKYPQYTHHCSFGMRCLLCVLNHLAYLVLQAILCYIGSCCPRNQLCY